MGSAQAGPAVDRHIRLDALACPLSIAIVLQVGHIVLPSKQAASPFAGASPAIRRADKLLYRMAAVAHDLGAGNAEFWDSSMSDPAMLFRQLRDINLQWLKRTQVRR